MAQNPVIFFGTGSPDSGEEGAFGFEISRPMPFVESPVRSLPRSKVRLISPVNRVIGPSRVSLSTRCCPEKPESR